MNGHKYVDILDFLRKFNLIYAEEEWVLGAAYLIERMGSDLTRTTACMRYFFKGQGLAYNPRTPLYSHVSSKTLVSQQSMLNMNQSYFPNIRAFTSSNVRALGISLLATLRFK